MEMQFYPPGWVAWPAGVSCDATKWCAALNIDSFSQNINTGQYNNPSCQAYGIEYVNFAFITTSGVPQPGSPPNPIQATLSTFTPNPAYDLFMKSGDVIKLDIHDTPSGLLVNLDDLTSGQSGSMTASAANGFAGKTRCSATRWKSPGTPARWPPPIWRKAKLPRPYMKKPRRTSRSSSRSCPSASSP